MTVWYFLCVLYSHFIYTGGKMFLIWNKERKNSISTSDYCYSIYFGLLSADLHHREFFWRAVRLKTRIFWNEKLEKSIFKKKSFFKIICRQVFCWYKIFTLWIEIFFRFCRWGIWKISKYRQLIQMIWKKYLFF